MKENIFEIYSEISIDLKCTICNELMVKACNAPCGCRFCFDCIEIYLNGKDKFCPNKSKYCQKKMINFANDIVIDNRANIQISEIVVKCLNKNCQFKDELNMIENHMRNCKKRLISCPYHEIGCEMNDVMNEEMKDHLNEENFYHSKLLIDSNNNLSNDIESMKNEIMELRRENNRFKQNIDDIILQSTDNKIIAQLESKERDNAAEIEELNQEMVVIKNEIRSMQTEIQTNSESMKNKIIELIRGNYQFKERVDQIELRSTNDKEICQLKSKERENATEIEELNQKLMALKNEIRSMEIEIQTNVNSMNKMRQIIELNYKEYLEGKGGIEMMKGKIDELCGQNVNFVTRLNNFDETFERIIDENSNNLQNKKIIKMETESKNLENDGEFEWKICFENLSKQKRCTRIYSNPFYLWKSGYKVCLDINIGSGAIIFVSFYLMCGEFDNKLAWPFKYAVTIDVIDQQNENIYQTETIKYSDCPRHAEWKKPSNDRKDGIWFRHISVPYNSPAVRNDQILIKCTVKREK